MNWFATVLRVVICFIILMDLTEFSVEFCVDEVFKDQGGLNMRRRREARVHAWGCPRHPKVIFKDNQSSKLGDAPEWHPCFLLTTIGILLETIFLFIT